MKKLLMLATLVALACLTASAQAQTYVYQTSNVVTASGSYCNSAASCNVGATGSLFSKLAWTVVLNGGTVSACTATVDSSPDNITWTAGGIIPSQTCTTTGSTAVISVATSTYIRVTVTMTVTGAPSIQFVTTGWATNPSGGGGGTTCGTPTCTVSSAGGGNGVLALSGNTSGTATITAPATAGTATNPIVVSNVLQMPDGSGSAPYIHGTTQTNTGIYFNPSSGSVFTVAGADTFGIIGAGIMARQSGVLCWNTSNSTPFPGTTCDLGISRDAGSVIDVGSGTTGSTVGKVQAAGFQSKGTAFTSNAGCSETTLLGGATAGSYVIPGTATCTVIVTMGNVMTATNGWACAAYDITTPAKVVQVTASTTTTVSITTTSPAASDKVVFHCIGY